MGARILCATVAFCLLAGTSSAQTGLRTASLPDRSPTNPIPPQATILRSGSLPDRMPLTPIPPPRTDQFLAGPRTYTTLVDRFGRQRQSFPLGVGYVSDLSDPWARSAADRRPQPDGYLQLEVQPRAAQVFVDGFYIGTADDFQRLTPGRPVEAGPHRVELRAAGYQPDTFDVRIVPNETITYRNSLEATGAGPKPSAAPPRPPAVPKTFYVIPGCYAGDKPPRTVALPRGCNVAKARAVPPVVSTVTAPRVPAAR